MRFRQFTLVAWVAIASLAAVLGLRSIDGQEPATPMPRPVPAEKALTLADLVQITLERNPTLEQAHLDVAAALGRAQQAGLYPNPTVGASGEELGSRDGPGGFMTAPIVTQEFVLGGKRRLNRRAALKQVDQTRLMQMSQWFTILTSVRQGYFDVLAAEARVAALDKLLELADRSLQNAETLLKGNQIAELDVLPFRIDRERLRADREVARNERIAASYRLTALMGAPQLTCVTLLGSLDALPPEYAFEPLKEAMLATHPDVLVAEAGIDRAELLLKRARVQSIPNITFGAGYTRNNMTPGQNEWTFSAGIPVPLFDRNQGNIQEAQALLGRARAEVPRVQNDLIQRLATAFGLYQSAKQRAERYRAVVLPAARDAYELSLKAFKGGQFEYLRVLQSQQSLAAAELEYIRALQDQWRSASDIAGLLLEEQWPSACPVVASPP
jgi:outer membrane protein, heavy metal efflux system